MKKRKAKRLEKNKNKKHNHVHKQNTDVGRVPEASVTIPVPCSVGPVSTLTNYYKTYKRTSTHAG
jgi:hypothetical protein